MEREEEGEGRERGGRRGWRVRRKERERREEGG